MQLLPCCEVWLCQKSFIVVSLWRYGNMLGYPAFVGYCVLWYNVCMYDVPLESAEQIALVAYLRNNGIEAAHIPNGGYRSIRAASLMKSLGTLRGMPDLHLLSLPPGGHPCWVELKRQRGGVLSDSQKRIHGILRARGDIVLVAQGWRDAVAQLQAVGYDLPEPDSVELVPF